MEEILTFIGDYYLIFIIITIILIFALIGYFAKNKEQKESPFKINNNDATFNEDLKNIAAENNMSLQERVNQNASVKNMVNQGSNMEGTITNNQANVNSGINQNIN